MVVIAASIVAREPLAALLNVKQEWGAAAVPATGVLWLLVCIQRGLLQSARAYRAVGLSIVLRGARPARGRHRLGRRSGSA